MAGLETLVGQELAGVLFIRDYVELHFDGPVLRILGDLNIGPDDQSVVVPEPGSRDALCRSIGHEVVDAQITPQEIRVSFSSGLVVRVPFVTSRATYDVAEFVPAHADGSPDVDSTENWESRA